MSIRFTCLSSSLSSNMLGTLYFSNPRPFRSKVWISFLAQSGRLIQLVPDALRSRIIGAITDKPVGFPWIVTAARLCFAYLLHWTIPSPCCTFIILARIYCVNILIFLLLRFCTGLSLISSGIRPILQFFNSFEAKLRVRVPTRRLRKQ